MKPTFGVDVSAIIVEATSTILGLGSHDILRAAGTSTFVELGGDSLTAIQMEAECQKRGVCIAACNFLRTINLEKALVAAQSSARLQSPEALAPLSSSHSVESHDDRSSLPSEILSSLHANTIATSALDTANTPPWDGKQGAISATGLLDRVNTIDWTELQLLLSRETSKNSRLNMLTIQKTYDGKWDTGLICDTWVNTIMAESIFRELVVDFDTPAQQLLPWEVIRRAYKGISSHQCIKITVPESELGAARARTGYTSAVYFAAAWALTLSTLADSDQIYFGMTLSGRDLPIHGAFDVVGPLINILPLFVQIPPEDDQETSIRAFLRSIQEGIHEINQVQPSNTMEGLTRRFTSIMATESGSNAVWSTPEPHTSGRNQLEVAYSTGSYSEEDLDNILAIFQARMRCLLQEDDDRLLWFVVKQQVMPREMEQTIRQWSNCSSVEASEESKGDDLVTLFEGVVARQPTTLAVVHGRDVGISYDDFDGTSAAVAHGISWVKDNEAVCVYADRSINWLIAIFGILKAGGVYTPLDPSALSSVREANFVRSGARVILFPSSLSIAEETRPVSYRLTFGVDSFLHTDARSGNPRIPGGAVLDQMTSRKFALHPDLPANQKRCNFARLFAGNGTVVAQVMSPVFDGSIHEIFSTITYGATLKKGRPKPKNIHSHTSKNATRLF
ncbi:hypothetical protein F5Y14DRAFT_446071 [Nemania sp. NC0429]|nr:hypothetical protein F5Y14DRAFT_446071 [Nemania sp. NC0429]